jgi:hypothetical protein
MNNIQGPIILEQKVRFLRKCFKCEDRLVIILSSEGTCDGGYPFLDVPNMDKDTRWLCDICHFKIEAGGSVV